MQMSGALCPLAMVHGYGGSRQIELIPAPRRFTGSGSKRHGVRLEESNLTNSKEDL